MINTDIVVGLGSLILAGAAYFATRDLSKLGGIFVDFTLWAILIFSLLELIKGFVKPEKVNLFKSREERNNVFAGLALLGGYLAILPFVGFLPSSLLFYAVMNLYLGEERLSTARICKSVLLSIVVVAVFYVTFKYMLEVPLPKGMLFEE